MHCKFLDGTYMKKKTFVWRGRGEFAKTCFDLHSSFFHGEVPGRLRGRRTKSRGSKMSQDFEECDQRSTLKEINIMLDSVEWDSSAELLKWIQG